MEVTVIDGKTLVSKDYSLPYDIGDIVNIIRPRCILPKATVVKLFGLNIYPKEEFSEYPSHLQDKAWKIVNVRSNYSFELCILLVSRNKEYVAIAHKVGNSSYVVLDNTPPIEIIRKCNRQLPTIEIRSKY